MLIINLQELYPYKIKNQSKSKSFDLDSKILKNKTIKKLLNLSLK